MKKALIISGPAGSGKSTLAKKIAELNGGAVTILTSRDFIERNEFLDTGTIILDECIDPTKATIPSTVTNASIIICTQIRDIPPSDSYNVFWMNNGQLPVREMGTKIITNGNEYHYFPYWFTLKPNQDPEFFSLGKMPKELNDAIKEMRGGSEKEIVFTLDNYDDRETMRGVPGSDDLVELAYGDDHEEYILEVTIKRSLLKVKGS